MRNIHVSLKDLYAKLGDAEVLLRLWDPASHVPYLRQPGNQGQGSTGEFTSEYYFFYADITLLAEN